MPKSSFMKKISTRHLFILFVLICSGFYASNLHAQLNITPNQTATALAQQLAGPGVQISNATMNCPSVANGIFKKVVSNLPLDSGIILTSGSAATSGSVIGADAPETSFASTPNGGTT